MVVGDTAVADERTRLGRICWARCDGFLALYAHVPEFILGGVGDWMCDPDPRQYFEEPVQGQGEMAELDHAGERVERCALGAGCGGVFDQHHSVRVFVVEL